MARRLAILLATLAAGFAAAGGAAAKSYPEATWIPAHPRNYPHAYRPATLVRYVVVHTIEGSYWGAISWFRNPRARVSSHYVVARTGAVAQMVSERRGAWHAGNGWMNRRSIGVEHEGYAHVLGTVTDAQYRASAKLVASVMRRYVLPIDRSRVIGHNEVRDPARPWRLGGYGGHSDPGPHWNWSRYLSYVRTYAAGRTPPPPPLDVDVPGLAIGQSVRGVVPWEAVPLGAPVSRVEFAIDGRVYDTQRAAPFVFGGAARAGWDSTRASNGRHTLTARAVAGDGRIAHNSVVVKVWNPRVAPPPPVNPPEITDVSLAEGQTVTGAVRWQVGVRGTVQRIEFLVDGVLRDTQTTPPYVFGGPAGAWDTSRETPGAHTLTIRAVGARATTEESIVVIVAPAAR